MGRSTRYFMMQKIVAAGRREQREVMMFCRAENIAVIKKSIDSMPKIKDFLLSFFPIETTNE